MPPTMSAGPSALLAALDAEFAPKKPAKKPAAARKPKKVAASSDAPSVPKAPRKRKEAPSVDEPSTSEGATRKRKKKDADAPVEEKRLERFKPSCPKAILDRVERVVNQRFFMIDRQRNGTELREEFSVLGSTGNVYTVAIDKRPSCNCPDFIKGNHCKHILFIFLKVLQVTQASGVWYQKALLTSELEQIFAHAPAAPNSVAQQQVRDAYARATGKAPAASGSSGPKKRMPSEEDDCPICYENMHGAPEAKLTFCATCANALHKECFQQWAKTGRSQITCVFCRAPWPVAAANGVAGAARTAGGYLNLAGAAGLSPQRDASSYYQGPRRGQRFYGYQDYNDDF